MKSYINIKADFKFSHDGKDIFFKKGQTMELSENDYVKSLVTRKYIKEVVQAKKVEILPELPEVPKTVKAKQSKIK